MAKVKKAAKKKSGPTKAQQVRDYHAKNPDKSTQEIATALGFEYQTVYQTLKPKTTSGKGPKKGKARKASNGHASYAVIDYLKSHGGNIDKAMAELEMLKAVSDSIKLLPF